MAVALCDTIAAMRKWRAGTKREVCFVPTMGALHEGHASLVREARKMAGPEGGVVVSVFVNPTQFAPSEDFGKYPRTLEADMRLCEAAGADVVFVPGVEEMYPRHKGHGGTTGQKASITVDPGPLGDVLEGAIRPGHFRGVCTVVCKLLNIVGPTKLLMGQKDYQQQAVLRLMLRDLDMPMELVTCPTIRELDGLAMSSRNRYLNDDQRKRAVAIFEALSWAKGAIVGGMRNAEELHGGMSQRIAARGLEVQYALACHAETLHPWHGEIPADGPCVLLVAAKLGTTRLIDNMLVGEGRS